MSKTFLVPVSDEVMSTLFAGYVLSDATLDELVDLDYEYIVFVDPNRGRYLSSIEDWQEYAVYDDDGKLHLRQSRMVRV